MNAFCREVLGAEANGHVGSNPLGSDTARPVPTAAGTGPQAACPAAERQEGREAARSAAA
ncbi:hypothetical protein ACQP1K_03790 [Sphaerimonospora sp. CA-214678]|uniref:hypothetical protein n=1 Tax=Sphaerimonospora sp. CA-214678 TaxID=3240029 RepID=UPI003D8C8C3F